MMCTVFSAIAQDEDFRIGFKFSPNISWMRPDAKEITSNGQVIRFGFGLNLDKLFSTNYAFGTGINVAQSGGELVYLEKKTKNGKDVLLERNRVYKIQYAEIPLTLKLRTNEIGYITYWGQFGIGLGFNIRSKGNDEVNYTHVDLDTTVTGDSPDWTTTESMSGYDSFSEEDVDIKEDINIFRTSMIIGLGIEYNISGTTSLLVGVTFNNGFSNVLSNKGVKTDSGDSPIFDDDENPLEYKLKAVNNYIELNLGVLF